MPGVPPDRGEDGGRAAPLGRPRSLGLHKVPWERDLGATLEGGGQVVRPLCRTNEQHLRESKIHVSSEEANQSPSGVNPTETPAPVAQDTHAKRQRAKG